MKIRYFLLSVLLFILPGRICSQDENILLTVNGEPVTLNEFERIYRKNNNLNASEKQTPEDYLDLFINFKLKVIEARNLGFDTTRIFRDELDGYINQLAKPYLTDSSITEQLLQQTYDRLTREVHAAHIMVMVDQKASPADTLKAYNKILSLRNRIISGEDFTGLAKTDSEDPSVVNNGGDLGWFGAFRMVYPFENAAYSTPPGQISQPVRSGYGYHIIRVLETRPARPQLRVAHIFVRAPETMNEKEADRAKAKILDIYEQLQNGKNFETLARDSSEDRSSGANGGQLPWFSSGEMIPEFENAAFALREPGDCSEPVRSFYGWHIIKLLERKTLNPYAEERSNLIQRVNGSDRAYLKQKLYIDKLKKEYSYRFNPNNYSKIYPLVDTSIFMGRWNDSLCEVYEDEIFSIGQRSVKLNEFGIFLEKYQRISQPYDLNVYIDDQFKLFSESVILDYEKGKLPEKHPEFAYIAREYHDGILLFNLTDKMVWSKALEDSAGLEKFYLANKMNYKWGDRVEAFIITTPDKASVNQAMELTRKYGKKKTFSGDLLREKLCPRDTTDTCIIVTSGKFEKGDNHEVDNTGWKEGAGPVFAKDNRYGFVFIKRKVPPEIKRLDEARGLITADYQSFLEKEWVKSLRMKYPVTINYELLKKIQ